MKQNLRRSSVPARQESARRAGRSALGVFGVLFAGEILACIADLIFSSAYGATAVSDAYIAASTLVRLPLMLLGAVIASTLIPTYLQHEGDGARRFAGSALSLFFALGCACCALMFAFCRPLARAMNPGFDQIRLDETIRLARIMLPGAVFIVLSMLQSALLEAHGRFVVGQLAVFPRSLMFMAAAALLSGRYGIDAVAWAIPAASLMQSALLYPFMRRATHYVPNLRLAESHMGNLLKNALPAVAGVAVAQVDHLIARAIASGLNVGDISAMSYSFSLIMFLNTVVTVPVTTVMFPRMSRHAALGEEADLARILARSATTLLTVLAPAVALGCVLNGDIVHLLYGRGLFDERALRVTSRIFLLELPGVLGISMRSLLTSAFHARMDTKTPLYVSCVTSALNVVLCATLAPRMGVNALALSTSVCSLTGALIMALKMRGELGARTGSSHAAGHIALSALGCAAAALGLKAALPGAGQPYALIRILCCTCGALSAYLAALASLNARCATLSRLRRVYAATFGKAQKSMSHGPQP